MPYTHCPSCRLSTFTAAGYSSRDDCPRCGTQLAAAPRRLFLVDRPDPTREPEPPSTRQQVA
jgi:hypothetical protein